MRPVVALVEARPETIGDDYRRALALAGLDRASVTGPRTVVAALDGGAWQPGRTCPPWQIAAALAASVGVPGSELTLEAVGPGGLQAWPQAAPWDLLRDGQPARDAASVSATAVPAPARPHMPGLEAVGARATVPFALRHQPLLVLAAADRVSRWGIGGACATLGRLLLGGHLARRGVSDAQVRSDIAALAGELFPSIGAVIDGTLWHVGPRGRAVARHVVIAGDDPVAVDAIALRLAGLGPRDVPWLGVHAGRGLGAVEPAQIRLVGNTGLLDLDFDLPEPTFARRVRLPLPRKRWPLPAVRLGLRRRPATNSNPWTALFEEMRTAGTAGHGG
jgi:hypothetical protein